MTVQQGRKGEDHNLRTNEVARSFVAHVESLFMPWNIEALVAGFTEDCVVRFDVIPELEGATRFASSLQPEVPSRRGTGSESSFAR